MPRRVFHPALLAAALLLALGAPARGGEPVPAAPPATDPSAPPPAVFTEVSAEACGSCHGTDGSVPHRDPARGPCRECHGDAHAGAAPVADTPAPPGPAPKAPDTADMAFVPAGPAVIGDNGREITEGKGNLDETPEHVVDLDAFYIDRYEVTNARYKRFVDATGKPPPRHWKGGEIPAGKESHPVVYVNWFDADAFCRWEGKRLPNELEWEKAARGPDGNVFPWGNRFALDKANTPQRWASLKEPGGTMPVGSFEAGKSPYGVYDMAGNVWEWTADWYLPYPGNTFPNTFYGHKNRVLRGGSWYDCLSYGCGLSAPSFNRSRFNPQIRNNSFGFRCALTPPAGTTGAPAAPSPAVPSPAPPAPPAAVRPAT